MSIRRLAMYVAFVAAYEAFLTVVYAWTSLNLPIILNPRLPLNWIFAGALDRIPDPIVAVLLLSCLWHVSIATGLFHRERLTFAFAIVESVLSIPSLVLYGSALLGFSGHGFTGPIVFVGIVVFLVFSVIPITMAYKLIIVVRSRASSAPV